MRILVVDDTRLIREMVSAIIQHEGYTPITASGATEALTILDNDSIDLILMDVEMPEMDGFELTRLIRQKLPQWIPIIFLTGKNDEQHLVEGIDAGGDDYLNKPVNSTVLSAKIRAMSRIAQMKADLDEVNLQLLRLTQLDPLTEVVNRRGLDESLERAWRIRQRERSELSLIFLDIDHFKPYNDNYGHQQGDECLKAFSRIVSDQLHRPADMLARFGGEEFVILLPNTDLEGAQNIADQILTALAGNKIEHEHSETADYVTASMGISSSLLGAKNAEELLHQADSAVYEAKESGRNRFVCFAPVPSE